MKSSCYAIQEPHTTLFIKLHVDPGLWLVDLTDRDREAFVMAVSTRDDDDVLLPQDSEGKPFPE